MKTTQLKTIFVLTLSLSIILGACKSNAKAQNSAQSTEQQKECSAKVNFGSMGTGIDSKTYTEITELLNSKKLKFTEKRMGREGETEICIPLTEMKGKQKTDFLDQLKKFENKDKLVSVSIL